ncbi:hypothetical protein CUN44_11635, partial [Enterococcus faecium]
NFATEPSTLFDSRFKTLQQNHSQNKYAKHFYLSHGFEIESEEDLDGFGKPYPITHLVKK